MPVEELYIIPYLFNNDQDLAEPIEPEKPKQSEIPGGNHKPVNKNILIKTFLTQHEYKTTKQWVSLIPSDQY